MSKTNDEKLYLIDDLIEDEEDDNPFHCPHCNFEIKNITASCKVASATEVIHEGFELTFYCPNCGEEF